MDPAFMPSYVFFTHDQGDAPDVAEIPAVKIIAPGGWNIAAFDDQLLPVFHNRHHHTSDNRPEVLRKMFILTDIVRTHSASDQTHLEPVDREIRNGKSIHQMTAEIRLSGMRCAGYKQYVYFFTHSVILKETSFAAKTEEALK